MSGFNNLDSHIIDIGTSFSDGVAKENLATSDMAKVHIAFAEHCKNPREYYTSQSSHSAVDYAEFAKLFPANKKLKILDIGVGRGESSVYLASNGHSVTSVEPGYDFCMLIAFVKNKFNLDIKVVRTVGEEINKIGDSDFDVVIFNASLHHCDNPKLALKNAYSLLAPGGKVILSSEIQIRPWMSKKKWYWLLENYPEKMGHYGGNEHAYYSWEYIKMLEQAGFQKTSKEPSGQFLNPIYRIRHDLNEKSFSSRGALAKMKFMVRGVYVFVMAAVVRIPVLFQPLAAVSIIPCQFVGEKK
ncbi:MAG: hypothetical protein B7Y39_10245 [Bdellovibrio sp. 28-41-41]|nr:MAG: hypothetical protein B7Y39_10245 [Bdellovibrio sp. 28-41-41]